MEMLQSFPTARAVVTGHNAQYAVRFDTVVNHRISRLTITQQARWRRTCKSSCVPIQNH
jgi:hypothetical protein